MINIEKFGDKPAFISDDGKSISYSQLSQFALNFKHFIPSRSLIFCLCKNSIGSLLGYYSILFNDSVSLLLESSMDKMLLDNLYKIYTPNFVWLPKEQASNIYGGDLILSDYDYCLLKLNSKSLNLYKGLKLLLTTSGSTGSPKLVRLSYDNLLSNAQSISEYLNITSIERPVTSLPMYYSYGLSIINSHLLNGATILLTEKSITQKDFWSFVKLQEASSMAGVPYTYETLKKLRFFNMDLPHLKTLTQAGGKLSGEFVKEFLEYAIKTKKNFYVMYGQTEATARMSYLPFEKALHKFRSIGIAIPGGTFRLIDLNGNEITEPEVDGELIYSGKNVSLGYAENIDDLSLGDINKGALHTGDIARKDSDGFYYITGRMKRFIKIFGNRVNLDAAEQIVKMITSSCACVGRDDKLIVYLTEPDLSSTVKLILLEKTGIHNQAFEIRTISEIPKSSSGKVLYSELQTN